MRGRYITNPLVSMVGIGNHEKFRPFSYHIEYLLSGKACRISGIVVVGYPAEYPNPVDKIPDFKSGF